MVNRLGSNFHLALSSVELKSQLLPIGLVYYFAIAHKNCKNDNGFTDPNTFKPISKLKPQKPSKKSHH